MNRYFTFILLLGLLVQGNAVLFLHAPSFGQSSNLPAVSTSGGSLAESIDFQFFSPDTTGLDTIPPAIVCPPNDTLALASGQCDTLYGYSVAANDSLMTLVPELVSGLDSGAVFPPGETVNIWMAVDTAGNEASCSFSVVVLPAADTAFQCRDTVTVGLGPGCSVALTADAVLLPPYGCAAGFIIEADVEGPDFGDGPWTTPVFGEADRDALYGFRVTNDSTGTQCTGFVRILDTLPPQLVCPEVNVPCALPLDHLAPSFLSDSLGIAGAMPLAMENCPGNTALGFVDVTTYLPCDSPGTISGYIRRFWTALDASGNVSTCVQTVNLQRAPADVGFPADTTIACGADTLPATTGGPFVTVGTRQYSLLDLTQCDIAAVYTDSVEQLCGGSRRLFRTWAVADGCLPDSIAGPVAGHQVITLVDTAPPVFQCPVDTALQISLADCRDSVDLPDLVVWDGCSPVSDLVAFWTVDNEPDTLSGNLGDFPGNNPAEPDTLAVFGVAPDFPAGVTTLLYVASDACGNTVSCAFTLTVWDSMPPQAVCDTSQVVFLDDKGIAGLPATTIDNGSSDACGPVYFKIRRAEPGSCDTSGNLLNDFLLFCCPDVNDTIIAVLRVYDVPVPPGAVPDTLAAGQYSECITPIIILDFNDPQCDAPADTTVLCEQFDPSLAGYGDPLLSCRVDSVAVVLDYSQFDTACQQGVILRTFRVFDQAGNSGQCTQSIAVENIQHYFVRFPDDLVVTMCDTAGNYGAPVFHDVACELLTSAYQDTIRTQVLDACFWIERTWTVFNWCTFDANIPLIAVPNPNPDPVSIHPDNMPGPVVSEPGTTGDWTSTVVKINPGDPNPADFSLFWAKDANGYRYKQIIRVVDIEQPLFEDCPANALTFTDESDNDYFLWNGNFTTDPGNPELDLCEGGAPLSLTVTDACFGTDIGVDYILFLDLDDDGIQETEVNSTDLPIAGLVLFNNMAGPGTPKEFDRRPVPPSEKYRFALQTTTDGRRLLLQIAWNTPGAPGIYQPMQLPLGNHRVQWTIYDGCGNENTCSYGFRVEDPDGTCAPTILVINGKIETEDQKPVANVAVQLDGTHPNLPAFNLFDLTDATGAFSFDVPTGASYGITPFRDDNHLNGVSTFDLLLINKHVLGLTPLGSPYKIIAADANKSNSVTTFDIVELRKLVLGLYQQLPSNTSWRFVPADFVFANPNNPFQGGLPGQQVVNNLQPNALPAHQFIGIKVGDVNGNVSPGLHDPGMDDRAETTVYLETSDRILRDGELFSVQVRGESSVAGMQFTLEFTDLELLDVLPGEGMGAEHFAVFPKENLLTASWENGGLPVFTLEFRARRAGKLSDLLKLSDRMTRSEAYTSDLIPARIALRFDGERIKSPGFELYQNRPNPFDGSTLIPFYLPKPSAVSLRVFDATGRLLWEQRQHCAAGSRTIEVDGSVLGGEKGVMYYQLKTDTDSAVRKMARW